MTETAFRIPPRPWVGVLVFVAYCALVMGAWLLFQIDYKTVALEANIPKGIILPLGLGALGMAAFAHYAGWWRAAFYEVPRLPYLGVLGLLLLPMAGVIISSLAATQWSALGTRHLALMLVAMLLVGFCEEMLTRGILVVALRGRFRRELWVWLGSSLLFGLMHATNAFFGIGAIALVQVLLAFCVGSGFYLLRRLSGSLLLPMLVHAAWDFSVFAYEAAPAHAAPERMLFIVACYVMSLLLVGWVFRREERLGHRGVA